MSNGVKKKTFAFLAWRKGFTDFVGLARYFNLHDGFFNHREMIPPKYYTRVHALTESLPGTRGSGRMTLLGFGDRCKSIDEFMRIAQGYGLSYFDAREAIGYKGSDLRNPTDLHIKALEYTIERRTNPKSEIKPTGKKKKIEQPVVEEVVEPQVVPNALPLWKRFILKLIGVEA